MLARTARQLPQLLLLLLVAAMTWTRRVQTQGTASSRLAVKYIVQFKQMVPRAVRTQLLAEIYKSEKRVIFYSTIFMGFATELTAQEVAWIQAHPAVQLVKKDGRGWIAGNVCQQNAPWGLARISRRDASYQDQTYTYDETAGEGTCAYVIDTGIDTTHPDFGGRAVPAANFVPDEDSSDLHGHGTHVAGVLGSATYGVAKKTLVLSVKVMAEDGHGDESRVLQGAEFITSHATSSRCPRGVVVCISAGWQRSPLIDLAMAKLTSMGIFVGAAAGNDNALAGQTSPGSEPSVCVVGGTDGYDMPYLRIPDPFENDDGAHLGTNYGTRIDVLAPAANVLSTKMGGGSDLRTGTSQACPHVVGIAAMLLSQGNLPSGLPGGRGLCNYIRDTSTTNAIRNLQPNTANRLAYIGSGGSSLFSLPSCRIGSSRSSLSASSSSFRPSHQLRPNAYFELPPGAGAPDCPHIDQLLVYVEVGPVGLIQGPIQLQLDYSPSAATGPYVLQTNNGAWKRVDVQAVFGSRSVSPIMFNGFFVSFATRTSSARINHSRWSFQAIKLRVRCANSEAWLENSHFASSLVAAQPGLRVTFRCDLANWLAKPVCSHLRVLRVFLKLSNVPRAGTENSLLLDIGALRGLQLAQAPARGRVYSSYVSILTAFASPYVAVAQLTRVTIRNVGGRNAFLPEEIVIKGACYGVFSNMIQVRRTNTRWIPDAGEWSIELSPDQWEAA